MQTIKFDLKTVCDNVKREVRRITTNTNVESTIMDRVMKVYNEIPCVVKINNK